MDINYGSLMQKILFKTVVVAFFISASDCSNYHKTSLSLKSCQNLVTLPETVSKGEYVLSRYIQKSCENVSKYRLYKNGCKESNIENCIGKDFYILVRTPDCRIEIAGKMFGSRQENKHEMKTELYQVAQMVANGNLTVGNSDELVVNPISEHDQKNICL